MDAGLFIGRVASRLLSVDRVFRGVQRALRGSLDARRTLERNMERVLAGANLPSARDVERVLKQVRELDQDLSELGSRIETLKMEQHDASDVGPHQKPDIGRD